MSYATASLLVFFEFSRYIHKSQGPSEQQHMTNFGEKGAWAYAGTDQIFGVPPIISGTGKLRTSTFVRTFIGSIGTKSH